MSNLLKDASILLTPTGYDNGRMNAIKPYKDLYGPELVANGDFSQGTQDWTFNTSGNNQWSVVNEKAVYNASSTDFIITNNVLTIGKKYLVSFDISDTNNSTIRLSVNSEAGGSFDDYTNGDGRYTKYITANTNYLRIGGSASGASFSIDNVSVVEDLSGDFTFSRNSAATRVNAQGLVENVQILSSELVSNGDFSQIGTEEVLNGNFSQEGSELVTNGDFATDSDWTLGAGWSISSGTANTDGTPSSEIRQNNVTSVGKQYKYSFTISNSGGGVIDARFRNKSLGTPILNFSNEGTYSGTFTSTGTFVDFVTLSGNTASFSIDNVSVKEVGQNWTFFGEAELTSQGARIYSSSGGQSYIVQSVAPLTISKSYKFSYEITDSTQGSLKLINVNGLSDFPIPSTIGTHTVYFTADNSSFFVYRNSGVTDVTITNISVKEVGQDWDLGTGWSIGEDKVVATDVDSTFLDQLNILTAGKLYKITYTILDYVSGSVRFRANLVNGSSNSANGTYTDYIVSAGTKFSLQGLNNFNGSITNISVKEITDDTDIPRINYSGFSYQDTLGSELVVNGDFSNGSANWFNPDGAATFSNNSVTINGGSGNRRINQLNVTSPTTSQFKLQYEITEKVGTSDLKVYTNNSGSAAYTIVPSTIGVHTFYFSSNLTTFYFNFSDSSGSITIDNVSVKEVTGQEVVPDSGCGSWLLEPQSTNLITYSEDFSQWNNFRSTLTPNETTSPNGTINAYLLEQDYPNTSIHGGLYSPQNVTTGVEYTYSFFVKKKEYSFIELAEAATSSLNVSTWFDVENGVVGNIGAGSTAQIENFGNGWYRCSISFTPAFTGSRNFSLYLSIANGSTVANIVGGAYIWGAQLEQQSYATSYIPTNGATNTRLQDIATNSGNSSLINSTEGVLYAEISALADDGTNRIISLSENGNLDNRVNIFYTSGSNKVKFVVRVNNSNVFDDTITLSDIVAYNKIALKYKENDFAIWINGIKETEQLSGSTYSENILDKLNFDQGSGSFPFYGNTKALAVYKEALTDANLRCLTYPPAVATTFDLDFDTIAEQFTFTRGSEATFVNEQGLIESTNQIGPELVTNGDFATDSNWSKGPNWTISDGKANSDGSSNGQILQSNVFEANKTYQVTFTATKVSGSGLIARAFYGSYETILSITESGTYTTKFTPNASTNGTLYFISSGLFVGSIDNVSVKEVISATNTPRIDYSTGAKAFLLEPQSTNYSQNSEQPSTWHSSGGVTITANAATSPEGIQNSSLVVNNTSSGNRYARNIFVFPSGSGLQTVTVGYFIKYYNNQWVRLKSDFFTGSPARSKSTYFDIQNGVIGTSDATHTAKIEDYGDGWYRCSITFDIDKSADSNGYVHIEAMDGDNSNTYAAIGQGYYAYGSQGEEFSYPTSYIPSGAAFTTRNQELCVDATPVINSEEGTLYAEIAALVDGGSTRSISLNDGTSNVVVIIRYRSDTNQIQYLIKDGINPDVGNTYTLTDSTNYSKIALKYKNNDITFWVDGSKIFTSTSPISLSNLNNLSFDTNGANPFFGNTKGLKYYPKALADVQLEDLTTI